MSPIRVSDDSDLGGGVDSRSNPVNMPRNRYLLLRNWTPKQDGHLQLRDGYVEVDMNSGGSHGWGNAWGPHWG